MLRDYPSRSFLGFSMMVTQAFLYNAIFFTYALVLANFYHIPSYQIGIFFFPFALGNLLGPLTIGHLFDTIGRRKMILLTYSVSAILLAISAALFDAGVLTAVTQTIFWCVIFFFASAGASSAYLTVSEIFPLELRGQAIPHSAKVLDAAVDLAVKSRATVMVAHIRDVALPLVMAATAGRPGAMPRREMPRLEDEQTAHQLVQDAVKVFTDAGVQAEGQVGSAWGATAKELLHLAEQFHADVIVVGSHGSQMSQILLGSVAYRVVHQANCPVLVVR
jgi:nucleotide-binding universal stress UspA family protein